MTVPVRRTHPAVLPRSPSVRVTGPARPPLDQQLRQAGLRVDLHLAGAQIHDLTGDRHIARMHAGVSPTGAAGAAFGAGVAELAELLAEPGPFGADALRGLAGADLLGERVTDRQRVGAHRGSSSARRAGGSSRSLVANWRRRRWSIDV